MPKKLIDTFYQSPQDMIDLLPIPAVMIHHRYLILYVNKRFADLHGSTIEQMQGRHLSSFSESAGQVVKEYFAAYNNGEQLSSQEIYVYGIYFQILIFPIYNKNNQLEALFFLQWNISKSKRLQQMFNQNNKRYKAQLQFDQLTGIANDYALEEYFSILKKQVIYPEVSILLIDIDHFSEFNKEHGFIKSNVALHNIAQTLKQELRAEKDFLAKLNSDRFIALFPAVSHFTALTIAERFRNSVYQLDLRHEAGIHHHLTVSIILHSLPISQLPCINHLIHKLSDQLRRNKKNGRNHSTLYFEEVVETLSD
ncbi:hypothetical protein GCM10023206_20700 [Acinetobacter puyangensis]|uniref:diguanylate cyclase n=1 Tax=Acinetobacter puyangensis TaxID=1096779 RepID=A0A240EDA2_9GAMM|nr:diguanylate cyclase [Acinetobacter puyangensis]SNX46541.1 PAS domain S-box-containing protein/diguanylate cyclase (GGDEF) domain-containing protein [Acinetobacter puyangensis]